MTELLEQVLEKVSALPSEVQDQLARQWLEEIEWETRWDRTLADSQDKIDQLAERAEEEYRSGKTKEMGFSEL